MKKIVFIIFILCGFVFPTYGSIGSYITGGEGGFQIKYLLLSNFDIANLRKALNIEDKPNNILLFGGFGFSDLSNGFYIGGGGFGGGTSVTVNKGEGSTSFNYTSIVSYGLGYGGLIAGKQFTYNALNIAFDTLIGYGGFTLHSTSTMYTAPNFVFSEQFIPIEPSIHIRLLLNKFMFVSASVSYFLAVPTTNSQQGTKFDFKAPSLNGFSGTIGIGFMGSKPPQPTNPVSQNKTNPQTNFR